MTRAAWLLGAAFLAGCGARRLPPMAHCAAAREAIVPTEDGASVRLHRHPHAGPPVLLVHGLGSRGQYWDLTATQSMLRVLNEAGFDAWALDLRGHGGHQETADGAHLRVGWTLDDYGRFDLKAAIDHIRAETGSEQVAYVGHSMGGMVAAVYHAWHGDDALSAVVILASPVDFAHPDPFQDLSRAAFRVGQALPTFPVDAFARLFARTGRLPLHGEELLYTPDNLDEETRLAMYHRGVGEVSRGEMRHLLRVLHPGTLASVDGERDYLGALETLDVPLMVIAGRADAIAPPDRVWPFYARAGSADKTWTLAGRDNGFAADYGHLDLTAGVHAPHEIHPLITDWLTARLDGAGTEAP